jgi:heme oxygenase
MLSEKLKENTKTAHIELEKVLVQKIKAIRAVDDYLEILVYFYRFFAPLEKAVFPQFKETLPDATKRRKAAWIMEDIQFFKPSCQPIHSPLSNPGITSLPQAIGALYVMEGSSLGGQVICKMVAQKLDVSQAEGFNFFSGYGEETLPMWDNFKKYIDNRSWDPEKENEVIDAANRTFELFRQMIDRDE